MNLRLRSLPAEDAVILDSLRDRLDRCVAEALDGRRVAVILDAPAYRNAGDLLILRGTLDVLQRLGVRVKWIQDWTLTSWSHLARVTPEIAVILQGGGNFGGLYPEHDEYRARVLSSLRDPSSAIVMPQSVHFPDEAAEARGREFYGAFPSASFLVRDSPSANSLRQTIPSIADAVSLCPDAAFGTKLSRQRPSQHDIFILQRGDAESTGSDLADVTRGTGLDAARGDWPSFTAAHLPYRALRKLMTLGDRSRLVVGRAKRPLGSFAVRTAELAWQGPQRLLLQAHVVDHVSQIRRTVELGQVLVTDRLHGHVAASLMGVPNVALNNADGKVEALIDEWTRDLSTTHFVRSPDEARRHLAKMFN